MHEKHRANLENTRMKTKKNQKRKPIHKLITKRKRANERRERITSRESPSLRPIKKSSTKRSKYLITGTIQILKSPPIPFLPNTPKNAQRSSLGFAFLTTCAELGVGIFDSFYVSNLFQSSEEVRTINFVGSQLRAGVLRGRLLHFFDA